MKGRQGFYINLSASNLVSICVDQSVDGDISGRLYHCYTEEPVPFSNAVQLLIRMEELYDGISFPQASTRSRRFVQRQQPAHSFQKVRDQRSLLAFRGKRATFVTSVHYRQNSAWQGDVAWMEQEQKESFLSTLEFLKLINHGVEQTK
ncbi:MAG: hypothetical protein HFI92_11695 [Lachnospiraceae bacterium]|nr:hypothetical protein [Lachnospiraceae bacterium]